MKAPIVAAIVDAFGKVRQLTGPREPAEEVTTEKLADNKYVARLWMRTLRDLAEVKRRFYPRRLDFEDVPVGATGDVTLTHNFDGRVRWWIVDASVAPSLVINATKTTRKALVLTSSVASIVTIRVEEAG